MSAQTCAFCGRARPVLVPRKVSGETIFACPPEEIEACIAACVDDVTLQLDLPAKPPAPKPPKS